MNNVTVLPLLLFGQDSLVILKPIKMQEIKRKTYTEIKNSKYQVEAATLQLPVTKKHHWNFVVCYISYCKEQTSYSLCLLLSVSPQVFFCDQTFDLSGQTNNQASHDHDWTSLVHLFHSLGPSHTVLAVHCG